MADSSALACDVDPEQNHLDLIVLLHVKSLNTVDGTPGKHTLEKQQCIALIGFHYEVAQL